MSATGDQEVTSPVAPPLTHDARTVESKKMVRQAPIRNANVIGASVYSHSGEFVPTYTDLQLIGRGLDLEFSRFYRSSRANHVGELGRGWSCGLTKKIEREGDDVLYHNGAGEVRRFLRGRNGEYTPPVGFYGMLVQEKEEFVIRQRFGRCYRFQVPEVGGRILSIDDKNHNVIQFSYTDRSVAILDTMRRRIAISVTKSLMQSLTDHAGRTWKYLYDKDHRLVKVTQPATADFPQGTSIKYAYDGDHRLISLTDAKGQTYLVNSYDKSGRVVAQKHGSGVYKMKYEPVGTDGDGFPICRTICRRKNGSTLGLDHNEAGNAIVSTLQVRREAFAPEDIAGLTGNEIPVVMTSTYNRNAELTNRRFPTGHETEWAYAERDSNPLDQGNLSQITELPYAVESDQASIVTKYEYESSFQLLASRTDARGNKTSYQYDEQGNLITTTYPAVSVHPVDGGATRAIPVKRTQQCRYAYNSMGQLLRRTHIDGSVTAYHYYAIDDPCGMRGPSSATAAADRVCGYLARVVRDAGGSNIRNEYTYDQFGYVAAVFDGKSNAARVRYNPMGKVESVTGREPFKHRIHYKYDANYNEIESAQSFERLVYDETTRQTTLTSTTLRELKEYNALDNVTVRRIIGDDKIVTESFFRDANERTIRQIQPLGNATEYVFDERDLLIEKISGAGTKETFSERFAYTLNGAARSQTDGNGNTTTHHYDGFQRYRGFTGPAGTTKTQYFDEAGNVVYVRVNGDNGSPAKRSKADVRRESAPLMEAHYHFDQWNRAYRMDQAWIDLATGKALGESKWNGEKGIVSTVVEYAENGLPGKIWSETGNVVAFEYDGAGRLTAIMDPTGEERSFEYDENGNAIVLRHRGPVVEGQRAEAVLRRSYNAIDRLETQQENDDAPERFRYNVFGAIINYVGTSGIEIQHMLDSLGRRVGHAFTVGGPADSTKGQQIVRRYEYDDNYRLSGYVDATGNRTIYGYDALARQNTVVYPDGSVARVEYDAKGNVVREVDANDSEIINHYDAAGQLIERRSRSAKTETPRIERYEYDGAGRLLSAITPDGSLRRSYDSLSRLLAETQGDRTLRYTHDAAGNLTSLVYPSGEQVYRSYDLRNRVTAVRDQAGARIASYSYRANDQVTGMLLGDIIETALTYNSQQRLESIEYRRTDDHALIEGFRYQYDATGKMTHEIQSIAGASYGERYYYDDAHRPIRAQYGVQDVFDPNSVFEQETSYEHFAEGPWKRRLDVDGQGRIMQEQIGTLNQRNRYLHFGKFSFEYDASGNCVRKESSNPGSCIYSYDQDNRLTKAECSDAHGHHEQTIEYFYDALGRQVRKIVTDKNGVTTEYTYVWAGALLIEEYENGVLARTYVYGIDATPIQFSSHQGRRTDYTYVFNGRGLASGLVYNRDPNAFAEMYGYELTGASFMREINGVKVAIPSRNSTNTSVANSILSGDYLKDWANGSDSFIDGLHTNPAIAAVLNSVNKGKGGVRGALSRQANDYLNVMGRGTSKTGPTVGGTKGGLPAEVQLGFRARDMSLVGNLLNWFIGWVAGELIFESGTQVVKDFLHIEPIPSPETPGTSDPPAPTPAPPPRGNEPGTPEPAPTPDPEPDPEPDPDDDDAGDDYVNPDSDSGSIELPSPLQIEAKLMQNKRPVNPDVGRGSSNIDRSSPPPKMGPGVLDPTIAYIDIDARSGGGYRNPIIGGGYTDPPRDDLGIEPMTAPTPGGAPSPDTERWT